jgi:hypothetical protein
MMEVMSLAFSHSISGLYTKYVGQINCETYLKPKGFAADWVKTNPALLSILADMVEISNINLFDLLSSRLERRLSSQ